jgi:ABC-type phosphate transport system auxiliary subunit
VLIDAFDDVVKTEVSRHDDDDHSFPVGINLKESNRKKRGVLMTALAVSEVAIALTDFVTENVRQSFDNSADDRDHQEIIDHFEQIQMELEKQTEELQSINQEIKNLGLSIIYFEHEEKIKDSLWTLRDYLANPNDRHLNRFTEKVSHLDQSIRILVDGLLGQHTFSHDIMVVMRDTAKVSSIIPLCNIQ